MKKKLLQYRSQIDEIDDQILALIMDRLDLVKGIGEIKESSDLVINDPTRENEIMNRLLERTQGQLSKQQIRQVFSSIFKLSKDIQKFR